MLFCAPESEDEKPDKHKSKRDYDFQNLTPDGTKWILHGNQMVSLQEAHEVALDKKQSGEEEEPAFKQVDSEVARIIGERYPSLKSCLLSWPYALIMLYSSAGNLRFSYYNSGLCRQVKESFSNDQEVVNELLESFSAAAMCALLVSPLNGLIMDLSRRYYNQKLSCELEDIPETPSDEEVYWTHMRALFPTLMILPTLTLLVTITQLVPGHRWLFYFQFVADISFQTMLARLTSTNVMIGFPAEHFGTLMGLVLMGSGLTALVQYALLQTPIQVGNGVMLLISILLYVAPLFYLIKRR
ncbi:hypothetical protein CSKR_105047 [Clonorchis sinensis]|uniref:Solute carrier family 43 member 3 n=1 Tax=Clonorchis sinensis TaxID=79923 RepID=A0A8T1M817_CLOSI|nr:hypothetical protein CSKR_105047 [Clonorchis sinensis]